MKAIQWKYSYLCLVWHQRQRWSQISGKKAYENNKLVHRRDGRNCRVYFISIHLSTAQQKCNTSLLLFSHFITEHREFHFDVLRIDVMSALKRVCNALLCWGEGNHHFRVCGTPTTLLNRIPCCCWCCLGAGPGNTLLLLGFRKLGKHVHFWICSFLPAAFGVRFSFIILKWKKQIFCNPFPLT